jgi:hypothetical protein
MLASGASAHTWNLENDFALSPDGVTAPPNPWPDSYANSGVWTAGFGGGGSYGGTTYSGLSTFTPASASNWAEAAGGSPGAETWTAAEGYPYTGVNSTTSTVFVWPGESTFMHPAPDNSGEQPRAAVRWVSPVTGTVSIEAAFNDEDCGGGDGSDYSIDVQPAGSSTFTNLASKALGYCGSGSYSSGPISVHAGDAYYFSVGDGGNGDFTFDTTGVSVDISDGVAESLSIDSPRNLTATYKQAITPANVSGADSDGDTVALSASDVPAGLSFNAGTGVLSGAPTAPAGRYVITFAANDGHGETITRHTIVTVEKGVCTLTNKPALLAKPTAQTFSVKMTETGTKTAIVGREVEFGVEGLFFGTAKTGSTGVAKVKAKLPEGGVYYVNSEFLGDASYQPCHVAETELVTVSSATYTATGAGQITVNKAASTLGFNVASAESGAFQLRGPEGTFSAANVTSLSKPTATSATWSGTGTWDGVMEAEYSITAVDPGTGADTVAITISSEGTTLWSSEGAKPVKGGDVKVH